MSLLKMCPNCLGKMDQTGNLDHDRHDKWWCPNCGTCLFIETHEVAANGVRHRTITTVETPLLFIQYKQCFLDHAAMLAFVEKMSAVGLLSPADPFDIRREAEALHAKVKGGGQ